MSDLENSSEKLSALLRLQKIEKEVEQAVATMSKMVDMANSYEKLSECVCFLKLILPILQSVDMLQYAAMIRSEIAAKEKELGDKLK